MEDALKCERFATVLGELRDISFSQSRRFQLATEQSKVTGFILRHQPRLLNTLACVSRWRITSLASSTDHEIPGVGFPRWHIELLKLRNGKPWRLETGMVSEPLQGDQRKCFFTAGRSSDEKQDKMQKRFAAIWFRHLKTDWIIHRKPELKNIPFVLALPDHGRMRITEVSAIAKSKEIFPGMVVADARVIIPSLKILDDKPGLSDSLLKKLCAWCIRYTPVAAIDLPDGLILDITGCAHLWGGEESYLGNILLRLKTFGFHVRAAIADTIGTAWAVCRYAKQKAIIKPGKQAEALMQLPPAALRLDIDTLERFQKLGLYQVCSFITMQRSALRRRFGRQLLLRLDQALGKEEEFIQPLIPVEPYMERLPCLEPIQTATGIEIALQRLLGSLCRRLKHDGKGLRVAAFKCYRIDGKTEQISISTNHPSNHSIIFSNFLNLKFIHRTCIRYRVIYT
jgi:hypothetical protein